MPCLGDVISAECGLRHSGLWVLGHVRLAGSGTMPTSPPHPCTTPGCPTLVPYGHARCEVHRTNPAHGWGGNTTRVRGRRLQRERQDLFTREPLCRICKAHGRTTLAVIRDHIVPLFEGGADDDSNVQPLCQACSDVKTQQEAQQGRT